MEIPKMKVFIYALTFLGYAWSGYGQNILTNLRDAVLSAEKVFGEVFQNIITIARQFKDVRDVLDAAVEESCEYKCPSGEKPKANYRHTPQSDGCGTYGVNLDQFVKSADVTSCCNAHDICYDQCNSGREKCDLDMQRCLFKLCDTTSISETIREGCKASSKTLLAGVMSLSCKAYLDAQKKACYCPEPKKSKKFPGGYNEEL